MRVKLSKYQKLKFRIRDWFGNKIPVRRGPARRFTFFYGGPNVADPAGIIKAVEIHGMGLPRDHYRYMTGWRISLVMWLLDLLIPREESKSLSVRDRYVSRDGD